MYQQRKKLKSNAVNQRKQIVEVGTNVVIPKGTNTIDATGKTIYPSFVGIVTVNSGINKPTPRPSGNFTPQYDTNREGYYWNDHIKPEYNAYENLSYDSKAAGSLREVGLELF